MSLNDSGRPGGPKAHIQQHQFQGQMEEPAGVGTYSGTQQKQREGSHSQLLIAKMGIIFTSTHHQLLKRTKTLEIKDSEKELWHLLISVKYI